MTFPGTDRIQAQTMDLITQGQRTTAEVVGAVTESWADAVRQIAAVATGHGLPDASVDALDRFFDTGIQVLEAQRALAHGVLGVFRPFVEAADAARS